MTRRTRPVPRSLPVQLLKHVARPCLPAAIVVGFAAIASWVTVAVALSEGDVLAAELLGYVTFWLGSLSVMLFVFVAFVVLLRAAEDLKQEITDRKGWGWT